MSLSPQKLGFELETMIHNKLCKYNIKCYRENEIKEIYNLNGVDHLIIHNNNIICLQDKWENKTPTIRDINHFIQTSNTILQNHNNMKLFGIFVSKKQCSPLGLDALKRCNFINIFDNIMISLVSCVEKEVIQSILKIAMNDNINNDIKIQSVDNNFEICKNDIKQCILHTKNIKSSYSHSLIDQKYISFDIGEDYHKFDFIGIQEYLKEKLNDYNCIQYHILYEIYNCYSRLNTLFGHITASGYEHSKPYMKKWTMKNKYRIHINNDTIHPISQFGIGGEHHHYGIVHYKKILKMTSPEIYLEMKKAQKYRQSLIPPHRSIRKSLFI